MESKILNLFTENICQALSAWHAIQMCVDVDVVVDDDDCVVLVAYG